VGGSIIVIVAHRPIGWPLLGQILNGRFVFSRKIQQHRSFYSNFRSTSLSLLIVGSLPIAHRRMG
jgi:hypothetical protein